MAYSCFVLGSEYLNFKFIVTFTFILLHSGHTPYIDLVITILLVQPFKKVFKKCNMLYVVLLVAVFTYK